jgi:hypothetical protein
MRLGRGRAFNFSLISQKLWSGEKARQARVTKKHYLVQTRKIIL